MAALTNPPNNLNTSAQSYSGTITLTVGQTISTGQAGGKTTGRE